MLEELCKRIQHCCATLRRSRNKRTVGSCWLKSLTGFKLCATTRNNIQQHATGCVNGRNMFARGLKLEWRPDWFWGEGVRGLVPIYRRESSPFHSEVPAPQRRINFHLSYLFWYQCKKFKVFLKRLLVTKINVFLEAVIISLQLNICGSNLV